MASLSPKMAFMPGLAWSMFCAALKPSVSSQFADCVATTLMDGLALSALAHPSLRWSSAVEPRTPCRIPISPEPPIFLNIQVQRASAALTLSVAM